MVLGIQLVRCKMAYINLGKFSSYKSEQHGDFTILYFKNEDDKDFYELCSEVPESGVSFLAIDDSGMVCGANNDLSMFNPNGFTVLQSDDATEGAYEPDGHPLKSWKWDGSSINKPTGNEDDILAFDARRKRNGLLGTRVDPIICNGLRWNALTEDKQAAWTKYRQDLLDVTNQDGFPQNIIWPVIPAND